MSAGGDSGHLATPWRTLELHDRWNYHLSKGRSGLDPEWRDRGERVSGGHGAQALGRGRVLPASESRPASPGLQASCWPPTAHLEASGSHRSVASSVSVAALDRRSLPVSLLTRASLQQCGPQPLPNDGGRPSQDRSSSPQSCPAHPGKGDCLGRKRIQTFSDSQAWTGRPGDIQPSQQEGREAWEAL